MRRQTNTSLFLVLDLVTLYDGLSVGRMVGWLVNRFVCVHRGLFGYNSLTVV